MSRSPRQIAVADHLWDAFARMAEEMGSDREALVNEAMHVFARLNGYVLPGAPDAGPTAPGRERHDVAERVLERAEALERDIEIACTPPPLPAAPGPGATPDARTRLRLQRRDGSVVEVAKDRYLLGRGAHCDLVIVNPKISREHAAFVREDGGWVLEDLGSSNGTWHRRERIVRRRVEDGDEYFLCSERITCVLG